MRETDSRESGRDDADILLDRAIAAIVVQPVPRQARDAVLAGVASWPDSEAGRPRGRGYQWAIALAAAASLAAVLIGRGILSRPPGGPGRVAAVDAGQAPGTVAPDQSAHQPEQARARSVPSFERHPVTRCLTAESAPVIVATNGRAGPLRLGEIVPHRGFGTAIHVWDWSKSSDSRIVTAPGLDEAAVWSLVNQDAAISPDGTLVAWESGLVLDLTDGTRRSIDLGGAWAGSGDAPYRRIGGLQVAPDGGRLVLLLGLRDETSAFTTAIQILDLARGTRLCQFPAQAAEFRLRAACSSDGRQIACADPGGRIELRDASTGAVLAQFEPALGRPLASVALSPDRKWIAASEDAGDLFVWDVEARRLAHRIAIPIREPDRLDPTIDHLKFSPDSTLLAGADQQYVTIYDVAGGRRTAELDQPGTGSLHWSGDGATLTAVTAVTLTGRADGSIADRMPTVQPWDWRTARKLGLPGNR